MQKIMFNDKYGLTKAVLEGRKTQTRRIIPKDFFTLQWDVRDDTLVVENEWGDFIDIRNTKFCMFKEEEIVAVAQSYKDCGYRDSSLDRSPKDYRIVRGTLGQSKGWNNKMFVRSDACKHQIRITNVRIERLQNISDEDCLAEGIEFDAKAKSFYCGMNISTGSKNWLGCTLRESYAALIDKVGKKGDWNKNSYVFAYEFELIK